MSHDVTYYVKHIIDLLEKDFCLEIFARRPCSPSTTCTKQTILTPAQSRTCARFALAEDSLQILEHLSLSLEHFPANAMSQIQRL